MALTIRSQTFSIILVAWMISRNPL